MLINFIILYVKFIDLWGFFFLFCLHKSFFKLIVIVIFILIGFLYYLYFFLYITYIFN